jgi:hypothetical protein
MAPTSAPSRGQCSRSCQPWKGRRYCQAVARCPRWCRSVVSSRRVVGFIREDSSYRVARTWQVPFEASRMELARIVTLGLAGFDATLSGDGLRESAEALAGVKVGLGAWAAALAAAAGPRRTRVLVTGEDGHLRRRSRRSALVRSGLRPSAIAPADHPRPRAVLRYETLGCAAPLLRYLPPAGPRLYRPSSTGIGGCGSRGGAEHTDPPQRRLPVRPICRPTGGVPGVPVRGGDGQSQGDGTDARLGRSTARCRRAARGSVHRGVRPATRASLDGTDAVARGRRLRTLAPGAELSIRSRHPGRFQRHYAPERRGFNLFMGEAACGTCHFAPLFGDTMSSTFLESEPEVIGVPATRAAKGASVDRDSGVFAIDRAPLHRHAFKTRPCETSP